MILLDYQNNYVECLNVDDKAAKKTLTFYIIILIV